MKKLSNYLNRKEKLLLNSLLLVLIIVISCRKENYSTSEKGIAFSKKSLSTNLLSKKSPDLSERLVSIKRNFYLKKLDQKFMPKDEKGVFWKPEWSNPLLQTVNDSVSYVFYRLKGRIKKNGKLIDVQELGAATYLVVKNETDFYKAFFYVPANQRSKSPIDDSSESIMRNFTGKLLLSSLQRKQAFLLDYKNGTLSDEYIRNTLSTKKLKLSGASLSGWETVCHYEMRNCMYGTYLPCGGVQFNIEYSNDCVTPTWCQNSIWLLIDYDIQEVCDQVWYPDPPQPPDNGGGSGGGSGGQVDSEDPGEENYELTGITDSVKVEERLECFDNVPTNSNTTYSIKICSDIPVNSNPNALLNSSLEPGHTFIELTKTTGSTSVTQSLGFYPQNYYTAALQITVNGIVADNSGHPYDASLIKMLNATEFGGVLSAVLAASNHDYNMTGYNCTNFALDIFNSQAGTLVVPDRTGGATGINYGKTPNELYKTIKQQYANQGPGASIAAGAGTPCNCN